MVYIHAHNWSRGTGLSLISLYVLQFCSSCGFQRVENYFCYSMWFKFRGIRVWRITYFTTVCEHFDNCCVNCVSRLSKWKSRRSAYFSKEEIRVRRVIYEQKVCVPSNNGPLT